jgi:hypothetical protein
MNELICLCQFVANKGRDKDNVVQLHLAGNGFVIS